MTQYLQISNCSNVSVIGNETQVTTIVFNDLGSGLGLVNVFEFFIANLNLVRNGQTVLSIGNAGNVSIKNCQVESGSGLSTHSSVLIQAASNVLISTSIFKNNQLYSQNSELSPLLRGGALSIYNTHNIFVKDTHFIDNLIRGEGIVGVEGGGLFLENIDSATLHNCIFRNNTALCDSCDRSIGGGLSSFRINQLTITDSVFDGNQVAGYGGAIFANHSVLTVLSCQFVGNTANTGGSIYVTLGALSSSSNQYEKNLAHFEGGAIYILGVFLNSFNDHFTSNRAVFSSGALSAVAINLTQFNCTFSNNTALGGGAASFTILENGAFNCSQNVFRENSAGWIGGGITVTLNENGSYSCQDNLFKNNTSKGSSGAVYIECDSIAMYKSSQNQFIGNSASSGLGGAVVASLTNAGSFHSFKDRFIGNTAATTGGAVSILLSKNAYFEITNSLFSHNRANSSGGAINVVIKNNSFCYSANNTYQSNNANAGGAVYVFSEGSFLSSHDHFASNSAYRKGGAMSVGLRGDREHDTVIRNSVFIDNMANIAGGAIEVTLTENSTYSSLHNQFQRNSAKVRGGAARVILYGNGFYESSFNFFSDNTAIYYTDSQGGAASVELNQNGSYSSWQNQFINNTAWDAGGAISIDLTGSGAYESLQNVFISNAAGSGGAVYVGHYKEGSCIIINNQLVSNSAMFNGGAVFVAYYNTTGGSHYSSHNLFDSNTGAEGGAISIFNTTYSGESNFKKDYSVGDVFENNAAILGGAVFVSSRNIHISEAQFVRNSVDTVIRQPQAIQQLSSLGLPIHQGAAIYTTVGTMELNDCTFSDNQVAFGGIVFITFATLATRNCSFSNNNGAMILYNTKAEFDGTYTITNNTCIGLAGAVMFIQSDITFKSTAAVTVSGNNGGGISLSESRLNISCPVNITMNTASSAGGGGITARLCEITIRGTTNEELVIISHNDARSSNGGGLWLVTSTLKIINGTLRIHNNLGTLGGGMYMERDSRLYVYHALISETSVLLGKIDFFNNTADYGGAIFISDNEAAGTVCETHTADRNSHCFIQSENFYTISGGSGKAENETLLRFENNTAHESGNAIFGGLFDRCLADTLIFNETGIKALLSVAVFNGKIGTSLTRDDFMTQISSAAVQACFCIDDYTYDCSVMSRNISVKKGEAILLKIATVDQMQNLITNPKLNHEINLSILDLNVSSIISSNIQRGSTCWELESRIASSSDWTQLLLYPAGPCGFSGISSRILNVNFLPCGCSIGFYPTQETPQCVCGCDKKLRKIANCSYEDKTIEILTPDWVGYINESSTNEGVLVHPCPFDYCLTRPVSISLSVPNGADMQCAFNRSNLLCGECQPGLSLILGSSKCMKCTNKYLALLLPFAILGILLVALILVLNMTVAVGTINGLIFYANIVGAGQSVFFSGDEVLPLKIFIAWLNLDFGIETCFYDGMTSNAKVLLQLVFPSYLILLTVVIIILCEYSQKFAALLGNRNPVATLCTLILLSYSKLLRMIIASLQFTYLSYPDNSLRIVWLYDANVPYFEPSRSVPLFLVSSIILALGAVYTVLLFFGQWLPRLANMRIMKWIRHPKYNAFIDAYHAPLTPKHRYWVGLLLLARIVHNLIQALTADELVILLTTICTALTLLVLKSVNTRTYKNWALDMLENSFIINLIVLSAGTFYVKGTNGNQSALIVTSISILIAISLFILCYHLCKYVLKHITCFNIINRNLRRRRNNEYQLAPIIDAEDLDEQDPVAEEIQVTDEPHNYTGNADTVSQERQAGPPLYDPPIIQSALIVDQLREPALDILDPVTAEHYREAIRRQPNPPPREPTTQFIDRPTH